MNLKVLRTQLKAWGSGGELRVFVSSALGWRWVFIFTSWPRYRKGKDRACLLNGRLAGVQSQFLGNQLSLGSVSWVTIKWTGKGIEVTVAYFKALAWRFPGGTEKKTTKYFRNFSRSCVPCRCVTKFCAHLHISHIPPVRCTVIFTLFVKRNFFHWSVICFWRMNAVIELTPLPPLPPPSHSWQCGSVSHELQIALHMAYLVLYWCIRSPFFEFSFHLHVIFL
jgi:hypothetical protein